MPISRIRTPRSIYPSKFGKKKRIHIPQPEERPLILKERDVVQWGNINLEPWWFTMHRRGVRRPKVGEDQREVRAVSENVVRGTLPERILYKFLVDRLRFVSGVDFDFQSSLLGGRLELGGIVADFLFPFLKIVIQVQGPTHDSFLRRAKDAEQEGDLSNMGYRVFTIEDETIYNEYMLEEWGRRTFGLANGMGGSPGAYGAYESNVDTWGAIFSRIMIIDSKLRGIFGEAYG